MIESIFKNDNKKLICLIVLIVAILEMTVFNFRFYQGLGYEPIYLEDALADSSVTLNNNGTIKFNSNNAKLEFNNVNTEIKNIYIDMVNTEKLPENPTDDNKKYYEENKLVKVKITADDKSNSEGITMPERSLVSTVERTKYIPLYLTGETNKVSLEFLNVENKEYKINNIVLNKGVPFHFSIIRVLMILFILGIIYIIRPKSKFYEYKLNIKSVKQRVVICSVVGMEIIIMLTATHINPFYVYNTVSWQSQYNELTEAILDGHYYLSEIPDSRVSELENPYDITERNRAGVNVKWDHSYYEGKYYVYFGIVPAFIFNIPAKVFFDINIKPFTCILILIPIFILMSYLLIYAISRRFKNKEDTSLLLYIMLSTLFVFGIGTAFLMVWPDMYTLPIFLAVVLAISGIYLWLTAFKSKEDDYVLKKWKLLLGSLCMALIAGCRPQLLLVLFIAIPLFWDSIFKERKLFSKNSIPQTLCFVLPIALFAIFMFNYNYMRFGSIFDFGANYNLTTNDMTARGINIARIPQGLFYYIIQPLNIEGVFPYITTTNFATKYMGITIKEGTYGGLLFIAPIIWCLCLLPKVKNVLKENKLYTITALLMVFGIIICAADAIVAGILSRYFIDFSWLFVLAAIITIFALNQKYGACDYWKIFKVVFVACFIISMLIAFAIIIGARYLSPADKNPGVFWSIASIIQFWM